MGIFSNQKILEEVEKATEKRITYKSKVKLSGFYDGQSGEVLEIRYSTIRKVERNYGTTVGTYWANEAITEYKIRLLDGEEVWVDSALVSALSA